MLKNIVLFFFMIGFIALWGNVIQARFTPLSTKNISEPIVIELFTSQSCSSCPPADQVLKEISHNSNVIALGFHVTYWNHLHWKDTLSREFSTIRQRSYSDARNSKRVYTPQMIVNGAEEFTGSNRVKLNNALAKAEPIRPLTLQKNDDTLSATIPNLSAKNYDIWLFGTKDIYSQKILRGENSGQHIEYSNAVIYQNFLGQWNGQSKNININISDIKDVNSLSIIIQEKGYGAIRAAGRIKL